MSREIFTFSVNARLAFGRTQVHHAAKYVRILAFQVSAASTICKTRRTDDT